MDIVDGKLVHTATRAQVRADFEALRARPTEELVTHTTQWGPREIGCPLPRKLFLFRTLHTGQLLSEHFHWRHRAKTRTRWFASAEEVLRRWRRDPSFLDGAMQRLSRQGYRKLAYYTVLLNSALLTLTHFRASVSKYLVDMTGAKRVLDFSAGWGDRLTGFLASDAEHIILIDPRPGSLSACERQHAFVGSRQTMKMYQAGAEDVLPTLPTASVDLIVTSPPYFDIEHYGETRAEAVGQIRNKVSSTDEYMRVFLKPVLTHCARILAPGGMLALNINDNKRGEVVICAPALKILNAIPSLTFVGTAGLQKGHGFGQGEKNMRSYANTQAEPVYIYRKR